MTNTQISTVAVNLAANAVCGTPANNGIIKIYDGPQPANCETAPSGSNHVLSTHVAGATAFGGAVVGVCTANAIGNGTISLAGVANWFRYFESDGTTVLFDGPVSNQTVTLTALAATSAVSLTVSALTLPLFAGQDLWFVDAGTLKKASVTANAAVGATTLTVSALAAGIANGSTAVGSLTVNSPNFQLNAIAAVTALVYSALKQGQ